MVGGRLRQLDAELRGAVGGIELLARLDDDVGTSVGINGTPEPDLDLTGKDSLGLAREGGQRLELGRALVAEVTDKVADHSHIEHELTLAAGTIEREGLPRPQKVADGRHRGCGLGRGRGHLCNGRGRGRRGCLLRLGFYSVEPLGHLIDGLLVFTLQLLELLLHLIEFLAERLGILGEGRPGRQGNAQQKHPCLPRVHRVLRLR